MSSLALEVALGHGLDVAVERGPPPIWTREPGDLVERGLDGRDRVGRVVRREVEEHDVVGGVAVRADLAGASTCDRTRVTCGAVATSRVAASTAASHAGVPAVSVSEV